MPLPPMSPEQRAEALVKARAANAERARVKDGLKSGATTLPDVLDAALESEPLKKMRVSSLLQAVPGVGPKRAVEVMERLGIDGKRRIGGLGPNQREALADEFA